MTPSRHNSVTRAPQSKWLLALVAQVTWLLAGATNAELLPQQVLVEREILHAETHDEPSDKELEASVSSQASRSALIGIGTEAERPDEDVPRARSRSVSVGAPNRGMLKNGVRLSNSDTLHVKGGSEATRTGTQELIDLIQYAADKVAEQYPGSKLTVGDLSRPQGGRLRPHKSHRVGRDADLGFYLANENGKPLRATSFVTMNRKGVGRAEGSAYRFDVERNWTFVKALLNNPRTDVQFIFVADALKNKLLHYAMRTGESLAVIHRAQQVLRQPQGSPHYSHFHVRVFCTKDDLPQCSDMPPFYAWHSGPGGGTASTQTAANTQTRADDAALEP